MMPDMMSLTQQAYPTARQQGLDRDRRRRHCDPSVSHFVHAGPNELTYFVQPQGSKHAV